jgi:hypothetical protein
MVISDLIKAALTLLLNFLVFFLVVLALAPEGDALRQCTEKALICGWRGRRRLAIFPKLQYFEFLTL